MHAIDIRGSREPRIGMIAPDGRFAQVLARVRRAEAAASRGDVPPAAGVRVLAVSKTRTPAEIRDLAAQGQRAFGENYVQEALAKRDALRDLALEWHLVGHLQSNKAREAATFDWVHSIDRASLATALARHRSDALPPLNVLVQVNLDDEASKSGCAPAAVAALADAIAGTSRLALRGLMAIPAPDPDLQRRSAAFRALRVLFDALRARHPTADTLSMGMSDDFERAIAEGATLVRIGTALFGERAAHR